MPYDDESGPVAWASRWWRALFAELVSTALLVWLGLAAAVPMSPGSSQPLAHVACSFGFVVIGNCVAFGPASGAHMNPAVTAAAVITGRLRFAPAIAYVVAQCIGAILGFGALLGSMPVTWDPYNDSPHISLGVTQPNEGANVTALQAVVIEAVLTGLLALACCAAWQAHDPARPDPAMPIKLGLLIAGLIYAGGPATGASLNPARSLAPALWHLEWKHQWVYWVGPLGGAALAAALHRWVLTPAPPKRAPLAPEELPLSDKP